MARKLKLFRITGDLTNLDQILKNFVNLDCVHPIPSKDFISQVHGLTSIPTENPWQDIYMELEETEKETNLKIDPANVDDIDDSYEKVKDYIHSTHVKLHELMSHRKETENLISKYQNALIQVKNISSLDISLDDIFSCDYINARFGKLPVDSLDTLKLYENKPFIFQIFSEERKYYWCMYMTTDKYEKEIDNIFSSLYFQRIFIPDFVHGTPEIAQESLEIEINQAMINLNEIKEEIKAILDSDREKLEHIKGELLFLSKIYSARKFVVGLGEKINISGYIADDNVSYLQEMFKDIEHTEIDIVPAELEKRFKPPKKLKKECFQKK